MILNTPKFTLAQFNTAVQRLNVWIMWICGSLAALLLWALLVGFKIAYDPQEDICLPSMRVAILHKYQPRVITRGDIVFWRPVGTAPLGWRHLPVSYAAKLVAGVPGDHLQVKTTGVWVNGQQQVAGTALARLYPDFQEVDTVIPAGAYFMVGTHPRSDDSRYWGLLKREFIEGKAYGIY